MGTPRERDPVEIRIHGRGGQGVVTLAALLADAAFRSGWNVLAFPTFGTERTGAPVAAFVRLSHEAIRNRGEVTTPSFVIVQDPTLVTSVDVLHGLTSDGLVLLDADVVPAALEGVRAVTVPATIMALDHLGVAKTSTAMLGAAAACSGLVTIDGAVAAITARFASATSVRNLALARAAYAACDRTVTP